MMKKITLIIAILVLSLTSWAQSWCGNSYMTVNGTWYTGSNAYVQPAGLFNGANIGTFTTNSFTLGGELQVWPATDNAASLWYSIDGGAYVAISLPRTGSDGNNSKHYGESSVSLTSLANGAHTISIYFQAGGVYDNNGGSNFVANFTKDVSTALSNVQSGFVIRSTNKLIDVSFEGTAHIELFTITGQLIKSVNVTNNFSSAVHPGIYMLRINGATHKVLVK
jgi:hypothetical protein